MQKQGFPSGASPGLDWYVSTNPKNLKKYLKIQKPYFKPFNYNLMQFQLNFNKNKSKIKN